MEKGLGGESSVAHISRFLPRLSAENGAEFRVDCPGTDMLLAFRVGQGGRMKYDRVTRWLHAGIALAVGIQLLSSQPGGKEEYRGRPT